MPGPVVHALQSDVSIRALTQEDVPAVEQLYAHMNEHDAYMRFFGARPKHLRALAEYTCRQDDGDCALGAFRDDHLLGVANYVRGPLAQNRTRSDVEIAIIVDHNAQSHGIGSALLTRLAAHARAAGIRWMTAEVLAENSLMLQVIRELGLGHRLHLDGSTMSLDIDLKAGDLAAPPP